MNVSPSIATRLRKLELGLQKQALESYGRHALSGEPLSPADQATERWLIANASPATRAMSNEQLIAFISGER